MGHLKLGFLQRGLKIAVHGDIKTFQTAASKKNNAPTAITKGEGGGGTN